MFVLRTVFHPAIGRGPKLEEWVRGLPQSGQRVSVSRSLTGPGRFGVLRSFEHLSDFERWRAGAFSPQTAEQLGPLLAQAPVSELWETTVAPPPGPAAGFVSRFTYVAAIGKAAELRRLLEERAQRLNTEHNRRAVRILVSGGPASVGVNVLHVDLAALEAVRAEALAAPDPAFQQQLFPCLARPAMAPELFQILATSQ